METKSFAAGDTCFDVRGQQYVYVARAHDGHIVRSIEEWGDSEPRHDLGWPTVVAKVYASAPSQKYAEEIGELVKKVDTSKAALASLAEEIRGATAQRDAQLKVLATHPNLAPVVEYMEGKLTHLALIDYGSISIKSLAAALKPGDESAAREGKVRVLSLYGGFHGPDGKNSNAYRDDLQWQLSHYSDGSGCNTNCIVGTSEESVRARLQAYLDRTFELAKHGNGNANTAFVASAMKLGMRVPEYLAKRVFEADEARAKQQAAEDAKNLERAKQEVARLTAKVAA